MNNEYSTPKLTPTNTVKIPSISGADDSGYMLNEELRHFMDDGITGVTEEYSSLLTYEYGKRLLHEGVEVRCIVPVESPEVFDPDKWQEITLKTLDERVLQNTDAINAITSASILTYSLDSTDFYVGDYIKVLKKNGIVCVSGDVTSRSTLAQFDYKRYLYNLPSPLGDVYFSAVGEDDNKVCVGVMQSTGRAIIGGTTSGKRYWFNFTYVTSE